MSKSLVVSVLWPAWEWSWNPATQWLHASYALSLSLRDATRCRRLVESPWYQREYPNVRITSDQDQKSRWELTGGGYRISTSVLGSATGEGGDRLVLDDPHDVKGALSEVQRQTTLDQFDQTLSTRLNDAQTGTITVIMQRIHEADLSGHLLNGEDGANWEHLMLPAEYEPSRSCVTVLGAVDQRTEPDELLNPERMPRAELDRLKRQLGPQASGQLQQNPVPKGGGLFKRHWWRRYEPLLLKHRGLKARYLVLDAAAKTGIHNDYSVVSVWGLLDGAYYVLDCWRDRVEYTELKQVLRDLHTKYGGALLVEDASAGMQVIQELRRPEYRGRELVHPALPVIPFHVAGVAAMTRAELVTPLVEAGLVHLPTDAAWVHDWIEEHALAPVGAHDDMVSTSAMAITKLQEVGGTTGDPLAAYFGVGRR